MQGLVGFDGRRLVLCEGAILTGYRTDPSTMESIAAVLGQHSRFVTVAHPRMDADALGSILALALSLESAGKTAQPLSQGSYPEQLDYLPGSERVMRWDESQSWPHDWLPEVVVVCDIGGQSRVQTFLDQLRRLYPEAKNGEEASPPKQRPIVVNIDHHVSNEWFGDYAWVESAACSTGEMVVDVLRAASLPIDADVATNLYAALLTDTGSFHYSNTTPRALRVAADLIEAGANPSEIARAHYRSKSTAQMQLEGLVLERMRTKAHERLAYSYITLEDLSRLGLSPGKAQDLVNLLTPLATLRIAAFFLEIEGPEERVQTKLSLRGEGYQNLSDVAKRYGGGGHPRASGATLDGSPAQHLERIVTELAELVAEETEQRF